MSSRHPARARHRRLAYRTQSPFGMCGSWRMTVNGVARWTSAATPIEGRKGRRMEIAPLGNLPVIRDRRGRHERVLRQVGPGARPLRGNSDAKGRCLRTSRPGRRAAWKSIHPSECIGWACATQRATVGRGTRIICPAASIVRDATDASATSPTQRRLRAVAGDSAAMPATPM